MSYVGLQAVATGGQEANRAVVDGSFATAYDILVRPVGAQTPLERDQGLVRSNFLSGVFGGISRAQYDSVAGLDGVEVAAPIANVGYIAPGAEISIPLDEFVTESPAQIFRVQQEWVAEGELSSYPDRDLYVYITTANSFVFADSDGMYYSEFPLDYDPALEALVLGQYRETLGSGERLPVCAGVVNASQGNDPVFGRDPSLRCFSTLSPDVQLAGPDGARRAPSAVSFFFPPVLLAAIDPVQEARLLGLDEAIVEGRYLSAGEMPELRVQAGVEPGQFVAQMPTLPVIASTQTFVSERLEVSIERLAVEDEASVPQILATEGAVEFLEGLRGEVVDERSYDPQPAYEQMLGRLTDAPRVGPFTNGIEGVWVTEPVTYDQLGDRVRPVVVDVDEVQLRPPGGGSLPRSQPPSVEEADFRQVWQRQDTSSAGDIGGTLVNSTHALNLVGRFDPDLLAGFSELSQVPMQSYYPPSLRPGDARSEELLGGQSLLPTMDLGSYVAQPPLMLTTLDAIDGFYDPLSYRALASEAEVDGDAPISSIRVRVADIDGPTAESEARIEGVAQDIRDATGLDVDVTLGSSPTEVTVELPAGEFGRPQLTLLEDWVSKGVSFAVVAGLDRKSAALFLVIQLVAGLFVANGAVAAVRSRRTEIGTLRAVGWSSGDVFTAIIIEMALIGLVAGLVGTMLAAVAAVGLGLPLSAWQVVAVVPIAVLLSAVTGVGAASVAARTAPIAAMRPAVTARASARPVRGVAAMAWRNVVRLPGRSALGAGSLAVSIAALTTLLTINLAYRGLLTDTRLGVALSDQIRPIDYTMAAMAMLFGALSVAEVIYLNLRERSAELTVLRAMGWSPAAVRRLGLWEGTAVAGMGSVAGIVLGVGAATAYGGTGLLIAGIGAAAGASAIGLLVSVLATLAVAAHLTRGDTITTLGAAG